jgi:hypothetical protein
MNEERQNLYLIQFDHQDYYVEAPSMGCAIEAWKAHVQVEWGSDWDGTEEPDSCALVHDEAVIRAEAMGFFRKLAELGEVGLDNPHVRSHDHPKEEGEEQRTSYYACGPIRATREEAEADVKLMEEWL